MGLVDSEGLLNLVFQKADSLVDFAEILVFHQGILKVNQKPAVIKIFIFDLEKFQSLLNVPFSVFGRFGIAN